jgi:hypothetical protein
VLSYPSRTLTAATKVYKLPNIWKAPHTNTPSPAHSPKSPHRRSFPARATYTATYDDDDDALSPSERKTPTYADVFDSMGLPPLHVCALPPMNETDSETDGNTRQKARPTTPAETLACLPLKLLCEMIKAHATVGEIVFRKEEEVEKNDEDLPAGSSTDPLLQRFEDCVHLFREYSKFCEELREHVDDASIPHENVYTRQSGTRNSMSVIEAEDEAMREPLFRLLEHALTLCLVRYVHGISSAVRSSSWEQNLCGRDILESSRACREDLRVLRDASVVIRGKSNIDVGKTGKESLPSPPSSPSSSSHQSPLVSSSSGKHHGNHSGNNNSCSSGVGADHKIARVQCTAAASLVESARNLLVNVVDVYGNGITSAHDDGLARMLSSSFSSSFSSCTPMGTCTPAASFSLPSSRMVSGLSASRSSDVPDTPLQFLREQSSFCREVSNTVPEEPGKETSGNVPQLPGPGLAREVSSVYGTGGAMSGARDREAVLIDVCKGARAALKFAAATCGELGVAMHFV